MAKEKTTDKSIKTPKREGGVSENDTEEKESDVDLIPGEETEDEEDDAVTLDDEEVNPFGDKWEE